MYMYMYSVCTCKELLHWTVQLVYACMDTCSFSKVLFSKVHVHVRAWVKMEPLDVIVQPSFLGPLSIHSE